jgi:hypothetical protein
VTLGKLVKLQDEARETLKKLVRSIEWKVERKSDEPVRTQYVWERERDAALFCAGLGSEPRHLIARGRMKGYLTRE